MSEPSSDRDLHGLPGAETPNDPANVNQLLVALTRAERAEDEAAYWRAEAAKRSWVVPIISGVCVVLVTVAALGAMWYSQRTQDRQAQATNERANAAAERSDYTACQVAALGLTGSAVNELFLGSEADRAALREALRSALSGPITVHYGDRTVTCAPPPTLLPHDR